MHTLSPSEKEQKIEALNKEAKIVQGHLKADRKEFPKSRGGQHTNLRNRIQRHKARLTHILEAINRLKDLQ